MTNPSSELASDSADAFYDQKGANAHFVGRQREIANITEAALEQRELDERGIDFGVGRPGVLITGAPGAGKTTLLTGLRLRFQDAGIGVIRMPYTHMIQSRTFISQVRRSHLQHQVAHARELWTEASEVTNVRDAASRAKWLAALKAKTSVAWHGLGKPVIRTARELATGELSRHASNELPWLGEPAAAAIDELNRRLSNTAADVEEVLGALTQMDKAFPNGWVILVDEMQNWNIEIHNRFLRNLLYAMCEPTGRLDAGIRQGNVLMAGLGNSRQVLNDLGITRYQQFNLGGFSQEEAEELIRLHLLDVQPPPEAMEQILETWPKPLAEKSHHWAQHAKIAAEVAKQQAKENPDAPHCLDHLLTAVSHEHTQYYRERIGDAYSVLPEAIVCLVMAAVNHNGGQLTGGQVLRLMNVGRRRLQTDDEKPFETEKGMVQMLHSGLLHVDKDNLVTVPIPSLANHCQQYLSPTQTMCTVITEVLGIDDNANE